MNLPLSWLAPLPHPASGLDPLGVLALAAALGVGSGLRLYAVLFFTGLGGRMGWVSLPDSLHLLQHPVVLGASAVMLVVEFFADKVPWLDSAWDAVHTFIRIPAGAAMVAGVASSFWGGDAPAWTLVAALLGGTLSATAHAAKTATRAAVNTSPEPFSNIALSLSGDLGIPAVLWLSWTHPVACLVALTVLMAGMVLLIVMLLRFLRGFVKRWWPRRSSAP